MSAEAEHISAVLGQPVHGLERVGDGRNSRVYRVTCRSGEYAAKFYFQKTADGRDRLKIESDALALLSQLGSRCVPRPVAVDEGRQLGIYEYVRGEAMDASAVSAAELDQVVAFASQLKDIARRKEAAATGPAAEAFFTIEQVVENVQRRLQRLLEIEAHGSPYEALRSFLDRTFQPCFAEFRQRAVATVGQSGMRSELPAARRTLSPSDFGFHNALRRPDGTLVFLDFEYFGWDDPAKLLSDLLLHPRMTLDRAQRRQLACGLDALFGEDPDWRRRVQALYPLFGLKWCMIMLNEFLPSHIARSRFIERESTQIEAVQMRQLQAAQAMLDRMIGEKDRFPYWSAAHA